MRITSSYVYLRGVRIRANHGVMPQEQAVGAYFIVDLRVGYPVERAMLSDNVADTLSYAELFDIVRAEMATPSKLVEHVAGRIVRSVLNKFPSVTSIDLTVTKENPPMGADCQGAGVELHLINDKTPG